MTVAAVGARPWSAVRHDRKLGITSIYLRGITMAVRGPQHGDVGKEHRRAAPESVAAYGRGRDPATASDD